MIMNIIKKGLITTVALGSAVCFLAAGGAAFAAAGNKTSSGTLTQTQQTDLANLKTKGAAEINRRITSLNTAEGKINSTTKLSSSDKAYLQNEVSTEISGLTALETTLNGETTVSAARTDVSNIFNEYRVYALVLPKVWLISAADGEQTTSAKLSTLATQLQTQITTDQNAGKNVSTLQNDLNDMKTQIANSEAISSAMETKVLTLQPTDYNGDHTLLSGDEAQLKTAHTDNQAASTDGKNIVAGLKTL